MNKEQRYTKIVGYELWKYLRQTLALDESGLFRLFISLLYLRRMDCMLKPYYRTIRNAFAHSSVDDKAIASMTNGLAFYNVSGIALDDMLKNEEDLFGLFDRWIGGFDFETREILVGLAFDTVIPQLKKGRSLMYLIQKLCALNLESPLDIESMRNILSLYNLRYPFAQFTSPRSYSKCISTFLFHEEESNAGISIYDPVCGSSMMLQEVALEAEKKNISEHVECYGTEINHAMHSMSIATCLLTGQNNFHIECANSLINFYTGIRFDYIIADLPMGLRINSNDAQEMKRNDFYANGVSLKSTAESYFMQMTMHKLTPEGRAAIITPGSLLFNSSFDSFRNWAFNNDFVEAIVRLPLDKAAGTLIDRYIWILTNHKPEEASNHLRLVDLKLLNISAPDFDANLKNIVCKVNKSENIEKYCRVIKNSDIAGYNVHLVNKKTGKTAETTVSDSSMVFTELFRQGFDATPETGDWNVLYDKTTASYTILFEQYFDKSHVRDKESNRLFTNLVPELSDVTSAISAIMDIKMPERKAEGNSNISSWAGNVPSSWQPISVQQLFICTPAYSQDKPMQGGKVPLLNVRYVRGKDVNIDYTAPSYKSVIVVDEDLLIIRTGSNAGEVLKGIHGVLGSTLYRMRFNNEHVHFADQDFAKFMLMGMSDHFRSFSPGIGLVSLQAKTIRTSVGFLPPLEEQKRIAEFLMSVCGQIDHIQTSLGVKIPKLQEFRESLIFDAVTGKLDL